MRYMIIGCLLSFLLMVPATAAAEGAGATADTQTFHNFTQTYHAGVDPGSFPLPCGIGTAVVTVIFNGVLHFTTLTSGQGAGTSWATGTMTGAMTVAPDNTAIPTYSGQFTEWFGDNNNLQNGTEAFTGSIRLSGSDGSMLTVHGVEQTTTTPTGITISISKLSC